jgi:PAS domain S-box-containing protein
MVGVIGALVVDPAMEAGFSSNPSGGDVPIPSTVEPPLQSVPPPLSFWQRPWPVRTALGWFALSVVLPALLFIALQYRSAVVDKQTEVERQGLQFARAVAADIGRELSIKRAQLVALSTSPSLRSGDYAAFYAQAKSALKGLPGRVALLRANGEHVLNTLRPFGTPLEPSRVGDALGRVIRTGQPVESDLFRSSITEQFIVASLYPVGLHDLVLNGSLPADALGDVLHSAVPDEWLALLVDRTGAIIARSRRPDELVGRPASAQLWQQASLEPEGAIGSITLDGIDSFTSWHRLANGWTAVVSVPRTVLQAPMQAWAQQVFWNLIFFSVLALAGAAIAGEWITRSIAELASAAARIGTGGIAPPVATGLRELNEVGEVLSRASRERRSAEAAMRESEERFRAIFDQATAGICLIDLDGRYLVANARHCDITGYSPDELRAMTVLDITHPADRPHGRDLLRIVGDGGSYEIEKRFVRKDGRIVWVHVSSTAVRDEAGKAQCALGVVLDITERKNSEMTNAHLAALVASSADAIKSLTLDGTVLTWNGAAERLFGYAAAEIVGKPLDVIVPADRQPEFKRKLECARRGDNVQQETIRRRKDGTLVEVSLDAAPIRAADGKIIGISTIARDITERRRAERELIEKEERLSRSLGELAAIYRTAPVGLAVFDTDLRFVHINDRVAQMDGVAVEDHIGRRLRDVVPSIADQGERIFRTVLETGKPVLAAEIAGTNPAQPGLQRTWLASWHPIFDAEHEIVGVNVVAEEITERKRAEATLQDREEEFRTLANSIPQLAWMANPDGGIFWFNERWYEYTGTTPAETEGWGWQAVHDPEVLPAVIERFNASLATGEPFDMTFPLKGADGAYRPFLTRMVPIRDAAGRIVRWFGTNTDITAQKEHEAHLNFVMRELSHRSKNLLAVVQAMARQTMQHSGDFDDFEGRFMGRLHGLARSHDVLVRQDWAGATIRDLVGAQLMPFVREDGASLDISGPDLMLKPDAVQNLGFALFELATNAVKYGALAAPRGRVQIHWQLVEACTEARVRFIWTEIGGPHVNVPQRKGFGSVVIERFMAAVFGGKVESSFPPEGFRWTLEIPAEHLLSEAVITRPAARRPEKV